MNPTSDIFYADRNFLRGKHTLSKLFCLRSMMTIAAIRNGFKKLLFTLILISPAYHGIRATENKPVPVLPPVAICRNITVQLGSGGTVTITGSDIDGGSFDPDGIVANLSVVPNTFSCSQIGANTVTLTVTDNEGKSSSCTAIVTVTDKTRPTVICRNYTLYLDASGKGTITSSNLDNGSSDNCPGTILLYLNRTVFDCSDIGSPVSVSLTGIDGSGNSSSCSGQVTILDTVAPRINLKSYDLVLGASGTGTLIPANIDNGTFDNCGPVTLSVIPSSFTCNDLGQKVVTLTARDSHGNSSSRSITISVSSTLNITGMSLSSCDLAPTLALFQANIEGGNGSYSYFWKGLDETTKPFMIIIPSPPSLKFYNTSTLISPFFNNTMANGLYNIRLVITDGNGCTDTSDIAINKIGFAFNNQTIRHTEACEGEIRTYSVNYKADATYSWTVTNGTILDAVQDTNIISVRWNLGVAEGRVLATLHEPNIVFPGSQCESTVVDSVTINTFPVPVFIGPATNVCANSVNTYTLTGTYPYQVWTVNGGVIAGGGRFSDNFVNVLWGTGPAGSVSVSVGNNSSCTGSAIINVAILNLTGKITLLTNIKCNGISDGTITVTADAGTGLPPFTYSLDGGAWQPGGTFAGISVGNHTAHIRDALLCIYDLSFLISQPAPVSGTITALTNVSCTGGSNGSVTVSASGGTPPYQFSLNGGSYQGSAVFSGLSAGSYTITVRDINGCTGNITTSLTQPPIPLSGTVIVTNISCFGNSTGAVNLTANGGTPPYSFLWSNGAVTEDLTNIAAGNYTVVITDSHGCSFSVNSTVTQPASALTGSVSTTNVLCFGSSTGAVNLTVTGGTPSYTFLWNTGATTEDLANVPAAVYTVNITDANGCKSTISATVSQPSSALGGSVSSQNNVSCRGGSNGSFTITGTGGTAPYQYRLGAGAYQASGSFGSLTAGTYSITIRDANICTSPMSVTITQPSSALSGSISSQTNVLCFGGATGIVIAAGSGGTSPYEYKIDGGSFQSSGTFNGLTAGAHNVTVRDKNLCIFSLPVMLTQPPTAVGGTLSSQTNVNCFGGSTGSVTITGTGGISPYTYSLDGGIYQPSGTFNNLPAGSHSINVRDSNLCLFPVLFSISQPASPLSVMISKTDVLCPGGSSGTATSIPAGGTAPYTYSWNTTPVQTTALATGLSAGTYTVSVTDSRGCLSTASITVSQPAAALTLSLVVTNTKCNGSSDGAIDLSVANGSIPLTYLWNNGAITEDLTALAAGTYSVVVTDVNGCTANSSGIVTQPVLLGGTITVSDVVCNGENTGSCNLTVTGGTAPYSYLWSNGSVTKDINNLAAGTYSVTITDANSCTGVVSGTIAQPLTALSGGITSLTDVTVYGGSDGNVTVSGSGGTPPYQYRLNSGLYQVSGTFNSLSEGSYTVTVQDVNLCTFDISVTIAQPWIPLTAKIDSMANVACGGGNTGSITIEGWGGTLPYEYSLNGGTYQSAGAFDSLTAGSYTVTIKDMVLDLFDTLIIITEPPLLSTLVSSEDNHCFGGSTGTATASVNGGIRPYSYTWSTFPVQADSTASALSAGLYTVTITDSNGCSITQNVSIGQPLEDITIAITGINAFCSGGASGSATANVSGGTAPYTYNWNTSPGQSAATATGLMSGNYILAVTDSLGCVKSGSVDIAEPLPVALEPLVTEASCRESPDGSIVLTITGGVSPYMTLWSDSIASKDRINIKPGTYSVIVTDNNACAASLDIEVGFNGTFRCVEIPQLITPNNDGFNDLWRLKNIDLYPNAEISVFNRWGKLVFRTKNISANPWDGRENGKLVPTDSYHYILYLNDGSEPKNGVVSVIR